MSKISAKDVQKLRQMTGAGMMDCKNALTETDGDFDEAIDVLRKKGQKIAGKRADRDATEGAVLAKVTGDAKRGALVVLNCETDFVAKNEDFVKFANQILDTALENNPANLDELKELEINGTKISDEIITQTGIIGEKIDLSHYERIEDEQVAAYIHPGNKLATIAGFNQSGLEIQLGKDVVMQIAAMAPVAVDKENVDQKTIDKEIEIGKELAIQEGKPTEMAEKIALGKLSKFFKEFTLLNQQFIKDSKKTVRDYLKDTDKDLTVTRFVRYKLGE